MVMRSNVHSWHFYTIIGDEDFINLYVSDEDAFCEDGHKGGVANTWWPENRPDAGEDDADYRYDELVDNIRASVRIDLDQMKELIHQFIGKHTSY